MKAVTIRLDNSEFKELNAIKSQGFASLNEVIKCAVMSFAASAEKITHIKKEGAKLQKEAIR